jgi:hypothetical protein
LPPSRLRTPTSRSNSGAIFPPASSKGLGTNHYSVEPSLLLYEKLSIEGQVGDWHPIGGSAGVPTSVSEGFAGDVFFYGIGPSYRLYQGNRFSVAPVVELFGWHVLSGFQTQLSAPNLAAEVSGMNIVNIKAGLRIGVVRSTSVSGRRSPTTTGTNTYSAPSIATPSRSQAPSWGVPLQVRNTALDSCTSLAILFRFRS